MKIMNTLAIVCIFAVLSAADASAGELDAADMQAMRNAASAYAKAWLTNDADTVMATFVDEPVLSPSGLPYLEGQDEARAFWFPPDSPVATVNEFDMKQIEASGSGDLGYVRGTFRLAFDYDGKHYENHGKFVTILRKGSEGVWRITHHVWDDFPRGE